MFKKTFLAVAVGAALGSTGAIAADLTPRTTSTWSNEAREQITDFLIPNVTVTLMKEYTPNDLMTLTYSGSSVSVDWPEVINVDDGKASGTAGSFTMTFGLLEDNGASALYRVTELTSAASSGASNTVSTIGATFVIDSEGDEWTSEGTVALGMSSETSTGASLESASSGDMITFDDQFEFEIASEVDFGNTIDVERGLGEDYNNVGDTNALDWNGSSPGGIGEYFSYYGGGNVESDVYWDYENAPSRAIFTTNDGEDSASVSLSSTDAGHHLANVTELVVTLDGPMGFLVDEDPETPGMQNNAFFASLAGDGGINGSREAAAEHNSDGSISFTFAYDGTVVDNEVGFYFDNALNGDGDNDMYAGSFTASASLSYAPIDGDYLGVDTTSVGGPSEYTHDGGSEGELEGSAMTETDAMVGAWDIDGSDVMVYAMPVTAPAQGFIWVTVSGQQDDATTEITGVATGEDGMPYTVASTSIVGNGIVKLSNNLYADMIAAGVPDNSRANIRVTTTAPACDVNVSATYKVDGDRLTLETSQTINGVHNTGNSGLADDLCILD